MATEEMKLPVHKTGVGRLFDPPTAWEPWALACGIGFIVLFLIAGFMGAESPGTSVTAAQLAEWYAKYRDISLAQVYVRGLAAFSMFVFATGVISIARRAEGRLSIPSLLAFGAAVAFSLVMLISNMANAGAAVIAGQGGDPGAVMALDVLGDVMRHLNSFSYALLVGPASAALLRARAVPRWVGWLGVACVPLSLVAAAGFPGTRLEIVNFIALAFLPLWPLVLSITLLRRSRADRLTAVNSE